MVPTPNGNEGTPHSDQCTKPSKLNLKEGAWIWRTFGGGCIQRLNDCRVQYKKCVLGIYSFPLLVKHVKVLCIV